MRTIRVNDASFQVGDGRAAFWDNAAAGDWESGTFEAISGQLTPETILLDFGTWIGPISLFGARKAKHVFSFEPDPTAAQELKDNIALNPDLAGKITVIERAVWPKAGQLAMGARNEQGDSMSSVLHMDSLVKWKVDAITPKEVEALVPSSAPLFIKIDVEGAEYEIVPALASLLARPKVAVLVFFHPRFAAGSGLRWHRTIPMSTRVFRMFAGWSVSRVRRNSVTPARGRQWLNDRGLPVFEAKSGYLFVKS